MAKRRMKYPCGVGHALGVILYEQTNTSSKPSICPGSLVTLIKGSWAFTAQLFFFFMTVTFEARASKLRLLGQVACRSGEAGSSMLPCYAIMAPCP